MAEILLPDCQFRRLSDGATCRDIQPQALCQACTAHVQVAALRARLESAEAARRDAQESRFALIIQNEELGADLADLRARLESAEQERDRLREAAKAVTSLWQWNRKTMTDAVDRLRAALAEVGQEQQHLVCSACGRSSDTEPRGGLCGMPRPPLGICCGRFRAALGAAGERSEG